MSIVLRNESESVGGEGKRERRAADGYLFGKDIEWGIERASPRSM